jgi:hypothetical protein
VLRHSNSNNIFISIVFGVFGTPCTGRGAGISIIGGADIHIFMFCPINFF